MLHHVSVGVRDIERAAQFYDAVLGELGYSRVMEVLPYAIGYGEEYPQFWIQQPHNQQVATAGNGTHISFVAFTTEAVDAFYKAAMEAGGQDAGAPGPRPDYSPDYYGAFVYDLDGNKLEATLLLLEEDEENEVEIEVAFADEDDDDIAVEDVEDFEIITPGPVKKPRKKAKKAKKTKSAGAKPAAKKTAKKAAKKVVKKVIVKAKKADKKDKKGKPAKADKPSKKTKKNKKDKKGKKK